jgi:hypothetical protein
MMVASVRYGHGLTDASLDFGHVLTVASYRRETFVCLLQVMVVSDWEIEAHHQYQLFAKKLADRQTKNVSMI